MPASFSDFDAWENEQFDRYNGEANMTEEEFWAYVYDNDYEEVKI